jgi:hypothetical protein
VDDRTLDTGGLEMLRGIMERLEREGRGGGRRSSTMEVGLAYSWRRGGKSTKSLAAHSW